MEILTPAEAAKFLGVGMSTLYSLQRQGYFDGVFYRVGKRVFYIKHKLQAWAEAGGTESKTG